MSMVGASETGQRNRDPLKRELICAIADAYESEELRHLVHMDMDKAICDLIAWERPVEDVVFDLLETVQRLGRTTELLRFVLLARPQKNELREAVAKHWPDALTQPQLLSAKADAQQVATGIGDIKSHAEKNPAVLQVINTSRDKLEQLRKDIDVLFNYKKLHDCLHEIQVSLYPQILDDVKQFRTNNRAPEELDVYIYKLGIECRNAQEGAQCLPDDAAIRGQEALWVSKLQLVAKDMGKALEQQDDRAFRLPLMSLKSLLRWEPVRINARLTSVAATLPLDELSDTIEKVMGAIVADGDASPQLRDSLESLRRLSSQLKLRVAEHCDWQDVEKNLWEAEDCLDRQTPESAEEFAIIWELIKSSVAALELSAQEKDWAKVTKRHAALIDQGLKDDFEAARKAFEGFRGTALFHFFWVDKELKSRCEDILKIREPLRSLLDKV